MRVGRRTRNEIVKWNQMTALRFQTSDDIPGLSSGMHLQCQVFIGWKHVGPRRSMRLRTVYFALNYSVHIVQGYKCVCVHQHTHTYVHTHTLHTHTHTQTHTPDKRIHSLYWIDGCLWGTSERVFDGCVFGEYVMGDTVITTYTLHTHTCTLWLATDTKHSEQKNKYAI